MLAGVAAVRRERSEHPNGKAPENGPKGYEARRADRRRLAAQDIHAGHDPLCRPAGALPNGGPAYRALAGPANI